MKRIWIWAVAFMLLAIGVMVYYFYSERHENRDIIPALKMVTPNTPMLMVVNSPSQLTVDLKQNPIWQGLLRMGACKDLDRTFDLAGLILHSNQELTEQLKDSKVIITFNYFGNNDYQPVFILPLKAVRQSVKVKSILEKVVSKGGFILKEREYNREHIYDAQDNYGRIVFSFSFLNNTLIFSPATVFVEDAMRQYKMSSIYEDPFFKRVFKARNADADANVFINHRYFSRLTSLFVNSSFKKSLTSLSYACWSCINLKMESQRVLFSGFSSTNDSLNNYLNLLLDQNPVDHKIDKVLPSNTSFYLSYGLSNLKTYFSDFDNYLQKQHRYYQRLEELKAIKNASGVDVSDMFAHITGDEIALAFTDVDKTSISRNRLLLFELSGVKSAKKQMEEFIQGYNKRHSLNEKLKRKVYVGNDEYDFYVMPFENFAKTLLGDLFASSRFRCFTFYDKYLVFADNTTTLWNYVRSMQKGEVLTSCNRYLQVKENLISRGNLYAYLDVTPGILLAGSYLDDQLVARLNWNIETIRNFKSVGWRLSSRKGMIENQGILFYEGKSSNTEKLWSCRLDAPLAIPPQIVKNHLSPDKREIIVQDQCNNLYLVDAAGNIEWKLPLPERIMGRIQQVDYYRSNKYQFLFNTRDGLYIVDRKGKFIPGFPVRFKIPATNGVVAVDYDRDRNYRYLIATENHRILALNSKGKPIPGWSFGSSGSVVTQPILYAKIGSKDYLVFADKNKVYILDRKGQERIRTSSNENIQERSLCLNLRGRPENSYILFVDRSGDLQSISFSGKQGAWPGSASSVQWVVSGNLYGNNQEELCVATADKLAILNATNGSKFFSLNLDEGLSAPPIVFPFIGGKGFVGTFSNSSGKISLFNEAGKRERGFPIVGMVGFDLGWLDGQKNVFMVVGNESGGISLYQIAR